VPDNLKSAVVKADRYAPRINPTYAELARHYGTAILPARPYKPKDKAKAEVAVQLAERWILARLRHQTFFSLGELNTAIRQLREQMNDRPVQRNMARDPRDLVSTIMLAGSQPACWFGIYHPAG